MKETNAKTFYFEENPKPSKKITKKTWEEIFEEYDKDITARNGLREYLIRNYSSPAKRKK